MSDFEGDIDLDEPNVVLNESLGALRAQGWEKLEVVYGAAFCGRCGNAAGLMINDGTDEIACGGCLMWGHPSFEPAEERYRDA